MTESVVDKNPPGIGPVFDYAFVDINDDNRLDIVLNNHHRNKPSPIWLGTGREDRLETNSVRHAPCFRAF